MNPYIKNLNRIEFLITLACTGRCKHCSEGGHSNTSDIIDGDTAAGMIRKTAKQFNIESLMTFGGEPLLYPEVVCKIQSAARDAGIPKRQLITNGYFSKDERRIHSVAQMLIESGVNEILLSVDAFHQETIPMEPVMTFAKAVHTMGNVKIQVHPAWLISAKADNPYNQQTQEILAEFQALGLTVSDGNVIFPSGNALKYLSEYFDSSDPGISPYREDPENIIAICVAPNGNVLNDNIYKTDILEILENYRP